MFRPQYPVLKVRRRRSPDAQGDTLHRRPSAVKGFSRKIFPSEAPRPPRAGPPPLPRGRRPGARRPRVSAESRQPGARRGAGAASEDAAGTDSPPPGQRRLGRAGWPPAPERLSAATALRSAPCADQPKRKAPAPARRREPDVAGGLGRRAQPAWKLTRRPGAARCEDALRGVMPPMRAALRRLRRPDGLAPARAERAHSRMRDRRNLRQDSLHTARFPHPQAGPSAHACSSPRNPLSPPTDPTRTGPSQLGIFPSPCGEREPPRDPPRRQLDTPRDTSGSPTTHRPRREAR